MLPSCKFSKCMKKLHVYKLAIICEGAWEKQSREFYPTLTFRLKYKSQLWSQQFHNQVVSSPWGDCWMVFSRLWLGMWQCRGQSSLIKFSRSLIGIVFKCPITYCVLNIICRYSPDMYKKWRRTLCYSYMALSGFWKYLSVIKVKRILI